MECKHITIGDLVELYKNGKLELNPPYQRRPVWKFKQRQLLMNSIFNGIPMPAVIFHRRQDPRKIYVYDVLDGKQRIETILQFTQMIAQVDDRELTVKKKTVGGDEIIVSFRDIKSKRFNQQYDKVGDKFWNYRIPLIEFPGEVTDFFGNAVPTMEIFVRINSTGSPLKKNEIRHASNAGPFFKLGDELERKYESRFINQWKVLTRNDVQRYVLHEFILELCTAIYFEKYTDKRKKLDELLRNSSWDVRRLADIKKRFDEVMKWISSIFSDTVFSVSRFRNKSEFYSLFVVLNEMISKEKVTNNVKNNRILGKFLLKFSVEVQQAATRLKKYSVDPKLGDTKRELLQYIISTREGTDTITNREIRHAYLIKITKGFLAETKDRKRLFDPNVKGILWSNLLQRKGNPQCPNPNNNPNCLKVLSFENAQIDHIYPWVRGGKTTEENARLICESCNKSKGARV